ncbi:MAG: TlyA family RNA methyltransferase [Anaerolineales bacterium]|nr:TlyA family RNA methyltransferase [Anaerolineales bacterium]
MKKKRIDQLLVDRELVEDLDTARRYVMAGQVRVAGQIPVSPAEMVSSTANIDLNTGSRFVSRGGEKLVGALEMFTIEVTGKVCVDVGASTGGFTDCLLQHGAKKVFAVDVGQGILHWKIRQDPRVEVMEGTNARYIQEFPEPVSLVTIDASFISLKIFFPLIKTWYRKNSGELVALIKPQFEAEKEVVDQSKGVVEDVSIHTAVLEQTLRNSLENGYEIIGLGLSPILGPKGNKEFLAYLKYPADGSHEVGLEDIRKMIQDSGCVSDS